MKVTYVAPSAATSSPQNHVGQGDRPGATRRHLRLLIPFLLLANVAALAAAPDATTMVPRLRYDVHFLAADALEGRFSGSTGARVASAFIAGRFQELGLTPVGEDGSFFQAFSFIAAVQPGPANQLSFELPSGLRQATLGDDFNPLSFSSSGDAAGEVVFAGYGIRASDLGYDDFAGLDVKDKIVLVMRFSPEGDDPDSAFQPHMALRRKAAEAREMGAAAVLVVSGPVDATDDAPVKISFDASFVDSGLPVLGISTALAGAMFEAQGFTLGELQERINERREPASRPLGVQASLTADVTQVRAEARNVLALLPGGDPQLKHEVVVVGAHFDHLGLGGEGSNSLAPQQRAVHNGADDNASGVAAMLEIARTLAARPPARSVLFAAFSAEEEGLLGSNQLVQRLPVAKENVTAMINLDMVGRPKEGPALTIGGHGTATEWPELLDTINGAHQLKLSTNAGGFGASDHSSFYAAGIPVLFVFTGAHEDYHKPSDDADRLDYPGMARVVAYATDVARGVAELPQRPTFQKVADEGEGQRRRFKVRTGVIPDFGYEGPGVRLSGASGGSPAEKAGLEAGDVVVRFGEREIRNIYDYMYALGDHQPGEHVTLTVRRGEATLQLVVTLEEGRRGGN